MRFKKSLIQSRMETSKLSEMFFVACDRIHQVVDDLYEALHEDKGLPKENWSQVEEVMDDVKAAIYQELDLIKSLLDEHER